MSIEAIHWVLTTAPIPRQQRDASTLTIVLIGLANHASPDGTNAFPSIATLTHYTRLSTRSVQYSLRKLEHLGLITPADPDIVAAHIHRADRRPQGWDLALHRHDTPHDGPAHTHRPGHPTDPAVIHSRTQAVHPARSHGVQPTPNGVHPATSRGAPTAPEPSLNRPEPTTSLPPVCGQCDARSTDPVTARVEWLDTNHEKSRPCPRCHPPHAPRACPPDTADPPSANCP